MDKFTDFIKQNQKTLIILLFVVLIFVFFAKGREFYDDNQFIFEGRGPQPGPLGLGIHTPNRVTTPWYWGDKIDRRMSPMVKSKEPYVHIAGNRDQTEGRGPGFDTTNGLDNLGVSTYRRYKENVGYSPFKTLENPTSPLYFTDYSLVDGSTQN